LDISVGLSSISVFIFDKEDWKTMQTNFRSKLRSTLVTAWPGKLEAAIKDNLQHVGKGYFNIEETNKST
jgi:hypothetical protein